MLSCYSRRLCSGMRKLIISSVGKDRIGFIRDVSEIIASHDGNIIKSEHMMMWGSFSEIILANFPSASITVVRENLKDFGDKSGINIQIEDANEPKNPDLEGEFYQLEMSIEAADNIGVLYNVTTYLSSLGINIEVLNSDQYSAPMGGTTLFNIRSTLSVPRIIDFERLEKKLEEIGDQLNMDIHLKATELK